MARNYWWFTEASDSFDSVADQESYPFGSGGVPSDIRAILELRYQDTRYDKVQSNLVFDSDNTPYTNFAQSYCVFANAIYPVPAFPASVTDGVDIKYYKTAADLTETPDATILIPDIFSDVLVAYAKARTDLIRGNRGSAADSFDEYNELLGKMQEEQNKYLFALMSNGTEVSGLFR